MTVSRPFLLVVKPWLEKRTFADPWSTVDQVRLVSYWSTIMTDIYKVFVFSVPSRTSVSSRGPSGGGRGLKKRKYQALYSNSVTSDRWLESGLCIVKGSAREA